MMENDETAHFQLEGDSESLNESEIITSTSTFHSKPAELITKRPLLIFGVLVIIGLVSCYSALCIYTALDIVESMESDIDIIDSCDDRYGFTCDGSWIEQNPPEVTTSVTDHFHLSTVEMFYKLQAETCGGWTNTSPLIMTRLEKRKLVNSQKKTGSVIKSTLGSVKKLAKNARRWSVPRLNRWRPAMRRG